MKCKSKPTYHKVKVSSNSSKKKSKINKKGRKQSTSEAANSNRNNILANAATASIAVPAPSQAPPLPPPPPPFLAASGIMIRTFGPTSTCSHVTTAAEHEPLPLPNFKPAFLTVTAPAAGSHAATVASIIQERQYLASIPLYHQQRIYQERQILIAQMRQRHQVQMELQRLNDMSSHIGEQFASSRNGNVQSAMMAQYARDTWNSRNIYYGGYRK
eukprot:scaffold24868_cov115-Skeletonema_marinoi.AAC.1